VIGNDVVDLGDEETAPFATHPRFDERVFAPEEASLLRRSGTSERLRWMLWAAKESAFKAARKLDPGAVFSPRRFVVRLEDDERGTVAFGDLRFALRVTSDVDFCHAVASVSRAAATSAVRRRAPDENPRSAVRALAIERLSAELGSQREGELEIVKEGGIPRVSLRGSPLPFDMSFSHHGRFVAFAYQRLGACDTDRSRRSRSKETRHSRGLAA
jgi:phosphopantetheinyl transferase (holo-ACP synthase)